MLEQRFLVFPAPFAPHNAANAPGRGEFHPLQFYPTSIFVSRGFPHENLFYNRARIILKRKTNKKVFNRNEKRIQDGRRLLEKRGQAWDQFLPFFLSRSRYEKRVHSILIVSCTCFSIWRLWTINAKYTQICRVLRSQKKWNLRIMKNSRDSQE